MKASDSQISIKPLSLRVTGYAIMFLGIACVILPNVSHYALFNIIGWCFLLAGGAYGVNTFQTRDCKVILPRLLQALLYLLAGVYQIIYGSSYLVPLTVFLTFFLLADSLLKMLLASKFHPLKGTGLIICATTVNVLFAFFIAAEFLSVSNLAIGIFIAINLLFLGVTSMIPSFKTSNVGINKSLTAK